MILILPFASGAKNLRTFHEAAQAHNNNNNGVIRLSYYGGGHYDSIHKFGTFDRSNNNENKMVRKVVMFL